ncbi:MAG: ABC transporter permease [Clostridiaceae bacterium]|nr:ABC transporter permease [Clostridiaceae bacterium]
MEFIKSILKNRKLIWQLGKNDFKNRFASTSLGSIWGFLQPFVFMFTYVIVFQYILKTGSAGNDPYVVWFLPAMAMWQWINDSILSASMSIRTYSYLVKKVVFPVDVIPTISIVASSFVALFLIVVATIVCIIFGYIPNILELLYVIFATYCFIIAVTRFTSAVTTIVPDFSNLLGIVMQLFFWFTPVVWNLNMLSNHQTILTIMKCTPFTYLITTFREVFIQGNIISDNNFIFTIAFWIITIVMFVWGNSVFKRNKKDFADVL